MVEEQTPRNRKPILWGITAGFLAIGLVFFFLWLFDWRFEESTKDAYVHGNQVVITPQIPGYITSVTVQDTELVEEGRILVELDKIDQRMALETTENVLAEAVRNVSQMFENVGMLKAEVEIRKANLFKAGKDYKHRKNLVKVGGVSEEDFQHAEADFIAAFAALLATQHQLRGAQALVENTTIPTHPLVEKAKDAVREAYVNFQRCTIRSPVHGIVAKKKAQVGESVSPETPLMTIVPLNQIWINANFKETQLTKVRIGQPVRMTSDIYGSSIIYHGKVIGISAGTGNVFSILPPQNATGNWIKIVQRLPIRICLELDEIKRNPLRLGLSMNVRVDIHDTSGVLIPAPPPAGPLFSTDIFENQDEGAQEIIQKIIKENMTLSYPEEKKNA